MNQEIAHQWTEALRYGGYTQGKYMLHSKTDGERFCCLGVLCDMAKKQGVEVKTFEAIGRVAYDGKVAELPESVRCWSGLKTSDGQFGYNSLARQNDAGFTFFEIADLIDAHIKEL